MVSTVNPDDKCLVCQVARDMHGDARHEFSSDGQLRPKGPAPKPKQEAPRLRPEDADRDQLIADMQKSIEANAVLRLVEVMIGKGLLSPTEVMFIFSGHKSDADPQK